MKSICYLLLLFFFLLPMQGQIIHVETGKTISNFLYEDSNGNELKNMEGSNQNSLGIGVRKSIKHSRYHISLGATYNRYGAEGSDNTLGNYYAYDVSYLGVTLAFDCEFLQPEINYNEQHGFSFYPKISVASEFLLNGWQNLNNEIYNLRGVEEFDQPLYFVRGGFGVNYYISKKIILFSEYLLGQSILIGNYQNEEELRIRRHNISIGVALNLFYIHD